MSSARQSAQLRVAAAAVVDVTTTAVKATRASKRTVSTLSTTAASATAGTSAALTKKSRTAAAKAPAAEVAVQEANASASKRDDAASSSCDVKASTAVTGVDAKSAWSALFAQKSTAKSRAVRPVLKPAPPISTELQTRVDAYTAFEGLTPRRAATSTKIVAWNVNGLRALLKKDETVHMRAYVAQEDPDVLCLSETKIDRDELQKLENIWPQFAHQYWSCAAKKGYAGTAILSKTKPLSVKDEIVVSGKTRDDEGRFLALEFDAFWLVHTYVPNAGQKLERLAFRTEQWDQAMLRMLQTLEQTKPVVWCGDLNVAHQEIDIHDPKSNRNKSPGFTDAERESFGAILASGFVDTFRHLQPDAQQFSYYSYRFNARAKNKGWRLDYFVASQALMPKVEASLIRSAVTGSDHVPIVLELQDV